MVPSQGVREVEGTRHGWSYMVFFILFPGKRRKGEQGVGWGTGV
jgi:hypothetical protein